MGPAIERPRTPPKFTSAGFSAIAAVAGGSYHTCAVASGGYVWCWGSNSNGQLGIGSTTDQHSPVAVSLEAGGEVLVITFAVLSVAHAVVILLT